MQAVVGSGAAAAAVLIIVYLFASGSDSPDGQPIKMPPGSYSFTRLRDTVVPLLAGHVDFTGHQLRTGRWSVLPKPLDPDSDPVLTAEGVFRPTDESERDVDGSKCIVVDLRGRVPGAAGAGAGMVAAPGDSIFLPSGSANPAMIDHCIESVFGLVDDVGQPFCCGFFISATTALTIYHDWTPSPEDTVLCQRFNLLDGSPHGDRLQFSVVKVDGALDVVLLQLASGQPPAQHFLSIPPPMAATSLLGQRVAVVGLGIPTAVHAPEEPSELSAGLSWNPVNIIRVGARHFAYPGTFGRGESGSALIFAANAVVGMHLAGWNYAASELSSVMEEAEQLEEAAGGGSAGGAAELKRRRADDRAIAVLGAAATKSVAQSFAHLTSSIHVGGWALSLVSPTFAAFLA